MIDLGLRNREERYVYELLDLRMNRLTFLTGVSSCQLDWSIYNTIRGTGNIAVREALGATPIEWHRVMVRPWIVVQNDSGEAAIPLLTGRCRIPDTHVTAHGRTTTLELLDPSVVLDEQKLFFSYSVAAGQVVTDYVRAIFRDVGIVNYTITDSGALTKTSMVWDPSASEDNVSWLRVVNDLLDSIGYAAVYADALGTLRCEPYAAPGERTPTWTLSDVEDAAQRQRYVGGVGIKSTLFDSYNSWAFYSRSTGEEAPLYAYAVNDDPAHPYSTVALGYYRVDRRTDVEASSQAVLQALADKAKAEAMADQRTFTLAARYIPVVESEVVRLTNTPGGISTTASVTARSLTCGPGAKLNLTLREV